MPGGQSSADFELELAFDDEGRAGGDGAGGQRSRSGAGSLPYRPPRSQPPPPVGSPPSPGEPGMAAAGYAPPPAVAVPPGTPAGPAAPGRPSLYAAARAGAPLAAAGGLPLPPTVLPVAPQPRSPRRRDIPPPVAAAEVPRRTADPPPPPPLSPQAVRAAAARARAQAAATPLPAPGVRQVRPFELEALERVPRESVEVWRLLAERFPAYVRSSALAEKVTGYLRALLAGEQQAEPRLTLQVRRTESDQLEEHAFAETEITIGTHASATLQLAGAAVSRRHARLVLDERGWCLVDMGSRNGTYLRGERVQPGYAYPLRNGETISLPGHEIVVRWAEHRRPAQLEGVQVASVRLQEARRFAEGVGAQALVALLRREPGGERLALEIDLPLAHLIVARLLAQPLPGGGEGVPLPPLLEVDKGVLELAVVKLLDEIQACWGADAEWTVHLERLDEARELDLAEALGGAGARLLVASVALTFDTRRDGVRVAVPVALAGALPRARQRAGESTAELYLRWRDLIGRAPVTLRAIVGRAWLGRRELHQLQPGDIMVPEEMTIRVEQGGVAGRVEFRPVLPPGHTGAARLEQQARIAGPLVAFGTVVQVEVDTIESGTAGRPAAGAGRIASEVVMDEPLEEAGQVHAAEEEELGEGAATLDEVPLPLVVELGRLQLTLRDLAGLRRGQVLELGRGADEPVSLVLEGRPIGTGRLVNVEGEIGVQIIELLR